MRENKHRNIKKNRKSTRILNINTSLFIYVYKRKISSIRFHERAAIVDDAEHNAVDKEVGSTGKHANTKGCK